MRPASVHAFPDSADLGRRLARALGVPARTVGVHRFPDGESRVRVAPPGGRSAVLIRRLDDPNAKLFEVLLAVDALRRAGAGRVALVVPYLPYMRQDRVFSPGEAHAQRVLAGLLGEAVDRLVTLEPHLHRIADLGEVFPCEAIAVPAAPLLAGWCRGRGADTLIVGPDEESAPWARAVAEAAGLRWVVGRKVRTGDRRVRVALPDLPPARRAVLVDDIVSTGATLAAAARGLARRGLGAVDAAVVHPVFAPGAEAALARAGVRRVVSCDSIRHGTNAIATAPALAAAVRSRPRRPAAGG